MSSSKISRVLVTGGAGYIGQIAVHQLLNQGYQVSILDDLSTGHADAIDPRAEFTQGSVLDSEAIDRALKGVDAIMHFAGKSLVGESVNKPELYLQVNRDGSKLLFQRALAQGVTRFVFSSTAATYGEPTESPISENSATLPTNPYGASKLAVDQHLTELAATGVAAISLRYFNVAGAIQVGNGYLRERHNPETHLIPNLLKATSAHPLNMFGDDWPTKDGTCIRDYIHVIDLIDAHILALDALIAGEHQIINLGSGDGYSVKEVIDTAAEILGRPVPYVVAPRRAGDPAVLIASVAKADAVLGWRPKYSLRQMISDAVAGLN
jgi:UDP-glucose 4-epimerase